MKHLQAANATRWNSQLRKIITIYDADPEKLNKLDSANLFDHERESLSELCDILAPFQEATMVTQGENRVTASWVIPSILGLKSQLMQ